MRILVCGGRDFGVTDRQHAYIGDMLSLKITGPDDVMIVGGAKGVDTAAEYFAKRWQLRHEVYPAQWDRHGKRAGPIRNQQMLDEGKPDKVIAFPGGKGTADMVKRARKAGIPVEEFVL